MPSELDNMDPEMGAEQEMGAEISHGDQEGAMAKQELIKLANYATSLQEHIEDDEELEAWVQAKITMAATNIASVYHYMAYEKKIGEYGEALNSPELSEGKRRVLSNWLMEAKSKVKELKKVHAEKKKVMEGPLNGGEQPCEECGGTGVVHVPGMTPHPTAMAKVEKYKRLVRATKAAHRRMDNQDGEMSPESEVDEEFTDKSRVGDSYKTKRGGTVTKTEKGLKHEKGDYDDEEYKAPPSPPKSHAKAQSSAEKKHMRDADKAQEKDSKEWEKKYPGSITKVVGGKKVDPNAPKQKKKEDDEDLDENMFGQGVYEAKGKKPDFLDFDKDGNRKEPMKKALKDKKKMNESGMSAADKAHHHACEYSKHHKSGHLELAMHHKDACENHGGTIAHGEMGECYHSHPHINNGMMYECPGSYTMAEGKRVMTRAAKGVMKYGKDGMKALAKAGKAGKDLDSVRNKYDKYDESAPSAGLSAAKKSATVKKAKAGEDIGKPGKGFKKVAAKAAEKYGSKEKGEKVAAAAMWKNIKEVTSYIEEKKKAVAQKADKDYDGDGKVESPKDEVWGSRAKAAAKAGHPFKESINESTEIDRIRQLTQRLLG
jgi:hypothetical protein